MVDEFICPNCDNSLVRTINNIPTAYIKVHCLLIIDEITVPTFSEDRYVKECSKFKDKR